ncbi:hypothetical protein KCG43_11440 [Photobacterium sp. WH24]|uniref:hypothetical protein n=1 Tax=Photobacterium sp. WH24 TaxID=2827237 RepID=UPI001C47EAA9|nr:hypothetical protein [Photobacterium sp. WH24]MBV7262609.1 hypothetical protein [Photobacterium sp. WH24]
MSRLSLVHFSALCDARQTLFVGPKSAQKSPLGSLLLSGPVVDAPGADNLKIRPEFFPVVVLPMYILKPSYPKKEKWAIGS